MPTFIYKARDKDGVLISGEIEAVSSVELKEGLLGKGWSPSRSRRSPRLFFTEDVYGSF